MGVDITFKSHLPEVMRKINSASKDAMAEAVNEVRNKTLEKLSGARSGRTYFVPGTHRTYTASAPGEAPAQATSALRQSVAGETKIEGKEIVGRVGTPLDYGRMLEFGTRRMAPRPWLKKAFEESEAKVKEIFMRLWFL